MTPTKPKLSLQQRAMVGDAAILQLEESIVSPVKCMGPRVSLLWSCVRESLGSRKFGKVINKFSGKQVMARRFASYENNGRPKGPMIKITTTFYSWLMPYDRRHSCRQKSIADFFVLDVFFFKKKNVLDVFTKNFWY